MTNLFRTANAWLDSQRSTHASTDITYRRGESIELDITATPGRTEYESQSVHGMTVQSQAYDFLVDASDLTFEPQPGDIIVYDGHRFEVTPLGDEACWRWSNSHRTTRRIHTTDMGADS